MGQYYRVASLTKREFIDPHQLGSGLKWIEQVGTFPGTGQALLILLGPPECRGVGDICGEGVAEVAGRWHGDRVALVGDYAEDGDIKGLKGIKLSGVYEKCSKGDGWTDITPLVARAIEKLFDGKYEGEGWREFKPDHEDAFVRSACDCCRKAQAEDAQLPVEERRALHAKEQEEASQDAVVDELCPDVP